MSESNGAVGRIVKVSGPVVDVAFPPDHLPEILNAVEIFFSLGGEDKKVYSRSGAAPRWLERAGNRARSN